jgi:acetylornithine deacetylase/succinyl-diaminopimelate desuccinylase-like protein
MGRRVSGVSFADRRHHDNNQHGQDENLRLENLLDAVAVYAAVISRYGR